MIGTNLHDELAPDDEAAIEAGRLLFAQPCLFMRGVAEMAQLPVIGVAEVAFAGRSNVGKSSLINALCRRKALARISDTPGRTQQINFFDLGARLVIVDLPGYGYARAPKAAIAAWTELVRDYLKGRPNLRRVCLLIDARHGVKPPDRDVMTLLDVAAVNYQVVLTKADKVKAAALEEIRTTVARELKKHAAAHPELVVTSARDGAGIAELRAGLAMLAAPARLV